MFAEIQYNLRISEEIYEETSHILMSTRLEFRVPVLYYVRLMTVCSRHGVTAQRTKFLAIGS